MTGPIWRRKCYGNDKNFQFWRNVVREFLEFEYKIRKFKMADQYGERKCYENIKNLLILAKRSVKWFLKLLISNSDSQFEN